jgi:hypothetical protein
MRAVVPDILLGEIPELKLEADFSPLDFPAANHREGEPAEHAATTCIVLLNVSEKIRR